MTLDKIKEIIDETEGECLRDIEYDFDTCNDFRDLFDDETKDVVDIVETILDAFCDKLKAYIDDGEVEARLENGKENN